MPIKLLALDFDGVIVDSAHECYLVCCEAARRLGWPLYPSPSLEKQFRQARPFVISAEDYYPILRGLLDGCDVAHLTQEGFEKLKGQYTNGETAFVRYFYQIRQEMQQKDFAAWCRLNPLFPPAAELRDLIQKYRTVIATIKDRRSAFLLLQANGFPFPEEDITGRERGTDKPTQMRYLMQRFQLRPEEILFIEDMLQNALAVKEMAVHVAMVSWGYSTPAQRKEARSRGIPIIKKEHVAQQIDTVVANASEQ